MLSSSVPYKKGGSVVIYIIDQCSQEIYYINYEYSNCQKYKFTVPAVTGI